MTKEYTDEVKQRAWELRDEGVPRAKIGPLLKDQFGLTRSPNSRSWLRWTDVIAVKRAKDQDEHDHRADTGSRQDDLYEDIGDISPEMERTIDELRRAAEIEAKTAKDEEDQDPADKIPLPQGNKYADAYEALGDIPEMEWNIDELGRRHVPDGEAVKLLKSYRRLISKPGRNGMPSADDSMYLVLCFKVQLYERFPRIQARKLARLARMYLTGLIIDPSVMKQVQQSLMFESRVRKD